MSDTLNMDVMGLSAAKGGNSPEIVRAEDERPRAVTQEDTAVEITFAKDKLVCNVSL